MADGPRIGREENIACLHQAADLMVRDITAQRDVRRKRSLPPARDIGVGPAIDLEADLGNPRREIGDQFHPLARVEVTEISGDETVPPGGARRRLRPRMRAVVGDLDREAGP